MKNIRWLLVVLGVFGLVGVRMIEEQLFYDPFLQYFQEANKYSQPEFLWGKLIINYVFRFVLNLSFSMVVIHFLFNNTRWTIQGAVLMFLVFAVTLPVYLYCLYTEMEVGHLFTFYMRRFVIQPLILLLIIPLFYYRKHLEEQRA